MSNRRFALPTLTRGTWQYFARENRVYYQQHSPDGEWSSVIMCLCDTPSTATRVAEILSELQTYREIGQITEPRP